jgi:hypothetical protein
MSEVRPSMATWGVSKIKDIIELGHEMSPMRSDDQTIQGGSEPVAEPTVSLWRVSSSLYSPAHPEGLLAGNPQAGVAVICGGQQPEIHRPGAENQSANDCELVG